MNYRKRNRNVFISLACVVLLLVFCACISSCKDQNTDSIYPEYTGDNPWTYPSDSDHEDDFHIIPESDNVIDFGAFTTLETAVSSSENAEDTAQNDISTGSESTDASDEETHSHGSQYDGIHDFPGGEFDIDAYETLRPLPDWTRPVNN